MISPAVKRITTLIFTRLDKSAGWDEPTLPFRILVALRRSIVPIRKPNPTVLARSFHVDVLPDLPPRARCLDQAGRFAELGEGEGLVLALEIVCVILAHDDVCIDGREKKEIV
jgi:hypothetical protein